MLEKRHLTAKVVLGLTLTGLATSAVAEVGVFIDDGGVGRGYVLQSIIDETEPVGIVWSPFFPEGPHRSLLNPFGAGNQDGPPSVILGSGPGFPVVAWSQNSPSGYDIVVSRFEEGAWTAPQIVAGSSADEIDPYILLDPSDGSFHLLYWVPGAVPKVLHRQAPADLSSWSAPLPVSHPAAHACRPSGVIHDGQLLVAYESHEVGYGLVPRSITLATREGQTFTSEDLASTSFQGSNWPQVHSRNGVLWIEWLDAQDEMDWTRGNPSGWDPIQTVPFATVEERDFHVRGLIRMLAHE